MRLAWEVCVVAAAVVTAGAGVFLRQHGPHRVAWRWLSGAPLDGEHRTNAGWLAAGSKVVHASGRASSWQHRPRAHRAAVRGGLTLLAVAAWYGWTLARTVTALFLCFIVSSLVALTCGYCFRAGRFARHRRTWVTPLHLAVAAQCGVAVTARPESWITVARDRSQVSLALPSGFSADPATRKAIAEMTAARLGLESPTAAWALAGPNPSLTIRKSQPPPAKVSLADIMPAIERAKPGTLIWGHDRSRNPASTSLEDDTPHLGVSGGSGSGKTATVRLLVAQALRQGAIAMFFDVKMISHQWAKDLPNAVILRRPHEIHAGLLWLERELERRNEVAEVSADIEGNVHGVVGPRLIVVGEELNAAIKKLRRYWRDIRDGDMPKRSPALDSLDEINFMGRQALCNVVYVGQALSVAATGGDRDTRESIGVMAMARYSPNTWKMLAGDHPMPPKSLHPGRWQIVGESVREVQVAFATAREARHLAMSGIVSPLPAGMPGAPRVTGHSPGEIPGSDGPDQPFVTVTGPSAPPGVTLRDFAREMPVLTLDALRQRRHRDESFPKPVGHRGLAQVFDPEELAAYAAGKAE